MRVIELLGNESKQDCLNPYYTGSYSMSNFKIKK